MVRRSWRTCSRDVLGAWWCQASAPAGPRASAWGRDGKVSHDGDHSEMVDVLCLGRSLPCLSAPGQGWRSLYRSKGCPGKGIPPTPPSVREGPILQSAEYPRSAEQPRLPLSSDSALLNSFQPRKLLSSAGTSPAKPAASRRRLSPGWRRLFWSVCRSFYLLSELCTAPVWDGKPGSCLPHGCRASLREAVGVRAHRPHAAAGTGIAPAALSLLVWCREVNAQHRDLRAALPKSAGCREQGWLGDPRPNPEFPWESPKRALSDRPRVGKPLAVHAGASRLNLLQAQKQ